MTIGTRFARAVAIAPTALPRPGGGVQHGERGRVVADGPAGGHPDHRPLVQGEHELEVVGQPCQQAISVEPGLQKIVVIPVCLSTSNVASRTVCTMSPCSLCGQLFTCRTVPYGKDAMPLSGYVVKESDG